jgi:hypothetical protein
MGARGPLPKPEETRRRRNKPTTPVTHGTARGAVAPEPLTSWHPLAQEWFVSLGKSGQSDYYEPSDWAQAAYVAQLMTYTLTGGATATLVAQVLAGMDRLLTTEAARRRLALELDKAAAEVRDDPKVAVMASYRAAANSSG